MNSECLHLTKYFEKDVGRPGIVHGYFLCGKYQSIETPPINSTIITWCADCGKKLKTVSLNDYVKIKK